MFLAKFWRTFAQAATGTLAAVVLLFQVGDYKGGGILLTLGLATAALAGICAGALALAGAVAATPLGKSLATLLQVGAAGFATVVFNSFADFTTFPTLALTVLSAAVVAAVQTFFQTSAEAATA